MRGIYTEGKRIVSLRRAAGLTQEQLATLASCDTKTVRTAERGKPIDLATLRRLAAALDAEPSELTCPEPAASRREANAELIRRFFVAFNARDPDGVANLHAEDAVVQLLADPSIPGSGVFRGRAAIRGWMAQAFADLKTEPITDANTEILFAENDRVFVRLIQPQLEHLPSGRTSRASLLTDFHIRNGEFVSARSFVHPGELEDLFFGAP